MVYRKMNTPWVCNSQGHSEVAVINAYMWPAFLTEELANACVLCIYWLLKQDDVRITAYVSICKLSAW